MIHSHTAAICENIALYALGSITDAPDTAECASAAEAIMDILSGAFTDSLLEQDIQDTLWQMVNVFHRKAQNLDALLDANVLKQRKLVEQQDGSEINSVELETAIEEGYAIQLRIDIMQAMCNAGSEQFSAITGSAWLPKSGSVTKCKALTASVIDSKDMQNARNLQKVTRLIPAGKRIAIAPGKSRDVSKIWAVLDKTLEKTKSENQDMVLLHGGGSEGVEKIAAHWAQQRNVPQVVFKPDWNKHPGKSAPFKRNEALVAELPVGLIVIANDETNGIQQQLIREAKKKSVKIHIVP